MRIYGREYIDELIPALANSNQDIALDIADVLGRIGDKKAIPALKELIKRNDLWGITARNAGIALMRLGDEKGLEFLKFCITNTERHRDLRIRSAKALIAMGIKNLFKKDEKIDFGGSSMTPEWSKYLENLVNKLRTPQ